MATKTRERPSISIQLWPGGQSIEYTGDPWGPKVKVRKRDYNSREVQPWRKPTEDELRSLRCNILANQYSDREIWCCDSSLVSELIQHAYDLPGDLRDGWTMESDNVKNLRPDPSNWDLEECKEWLEDKGHDLPEFNPWTMSRDDLAALFEDDEHYTRLGQVKDLTEEQLRELVIEDIDDETIDGIEAFRDAVRDNAEDAEVFEWWRVSSWFASQLEQIGAVVLDNGYGHWWGRTCTGQSYLMDGSLQKVAALHVK